MLSQGTSLNIQIYTVWRIFQKSENVAVFKLKSFFFFKHIKGTQRSRQQHTHRPPPCSHAGEHAVSAVARFVQQEARGSDPAFNSTHLLRHKRPGLQPWPSTPPAWVQPGVVSHTRGFGERSAGQPGVFKRNETARLQMDVNRFLCFLVHFIEKIRLDQIRLDQIRLDLMAKQRPPVQRNKVDAKTAKM